MIDQLYLEFYWIPVRLADMAFHSYLHLVGFKIPILVAIR